jgi:hypothetical protein
MGRRPHSRTHGGPDNLRWFWSKTITDPMVRVATLEEAEAKIREA